MYCRFPQKLKDNFSGMKVLHWYVSLSFERSMYIKCACHTGLQKYVCV